MQNVPQSLEDDLMFSRLASVYLRRIVTDQPNVFSLPLDEEFSHWIGHQCGLEKQHFPNLYTFIDFITRTTAQAAEDDLSIAALRADSWRSTILSSKLRLLSNILVYNENNFRSTGKNTCI